MLINYFFHYYYRRKIFIQISWKNFNTMQQSFHFTLQEVNLKYLNLLQLIFSIPASFDPGKTLL